MAIFFLLKRPKTLAAALTITTTRSMGGGPRTFPGGLNKWQYKRMHEKLAKEKEHKLLSQEKQLYLARLRSEIRAKRVSNQQSSPKLPDSSYNYTGLSSKEHIKMLADRFMKARAEDLWNEDDGPIRSETSRDLEEKPLDLKKIVKDGRSSIGKLGSFEQRRNYSNPRRNLSSDDDDESHDGNRGGLIGLETRALNSKKFVKDGKSLVGKILPFKQRKENARWRRNSSSDDEDEYGGELIRKELKISRFGNGVDKEEEEERGFGGRRRKGMMTGAALMKYDGKKERRAPRGDDEGESDLLEQIRGMREEIKSRESLQRGVVAKEESMLTQKRFDDYNISPLTIKALNSAGYVQMTVVQEAALPLCLEGRDILVKARTGTGKSVAFLLPAIEAVLKATGSNSNNRVPPILALIICPTRELAIQLAAEANVLVRHHDGIGILTLIGGTRFKLDQKRLESNPCQIIVATPGRLLDHIENKSGFSARLMGLKLLILDEADHLLDLGFRKDIEKIVDCIPRQRQSLLFSATIPKEVRRISQVVLKKEHVFVDTVGLGNVETPAKVMQSFIVAPHELHFHLVHHLLKEHITQELDYKVIVFCTTAMGAALMYILLRDLKMNVREMHSRKPQLYRARISDEFRESKRLILVTSDVSSRGVHYPDVTLVLQIGIPSVREQYIHRLGRTGREGKDGKGILLLAPWEEYFMQEIGDLPIEKHPIPELGSDIKQKVEESIGKVDTSTKEAAYHAWLGYYNSISEIGRDKTMLADLGTQFCHSIGLEKPPSLYRKTAIKMGLKDVPGIRIRK